MIGGALYRAKEHGKKMTSSTVTGLPSEKTRLFIHGEGDPAAIFWRLKSVAPKAHRAKTVRHRARAIRLSKT